MGILESTVGHHRNQVALIKALIDGRLPSQFLFVGPEGVGKKRFAWGLAEIFLCQRPPEPGRACGLCASCIKIRSGFHESVLFIEPEKNLIKLEKAREIQDFLALAQAGGVRVVIVDNAHTLNPQASNALLKVFEEPPPNTYFFFITHRWTQVLPTIRSRATRVAFGPLSSVELEKWSDGRPELLTLARGSLKELLEQKQEDRQELRQEAMTLWEKFFTQKDFLVLGDWREALKDRDKLLLLSRYWLVNLHSLMTKRVVAGSATNEVNLLASMTDDELWDLWDRGLKLEGGLLGHRDPILLMEEWLLPVLDSKAFV